jgi:hypothetical protein
MSHRKIEPDEGADHSNVVVLRPPRSGTGGEDGAQGMRGTSTLVQISSRSDTMTHDGLDLLRAFLTIDDAAARASLITLAQKLASQSPKR